MLLGGEEGTERIRKGQLRKGRPKTLRGSSGGGTIIILNPEKMQELSEEERKASIGR